MLFLIILLVFVFYKLIPAPTFQARPSSLNDTYPPPIDTPTPANVGYPPPRYFPATSSVPTVIYPTPTLYPYMFSSPAQATAFYLYLQHTPSSSELGSQATYIASEKTLAAKIDLDKASGLPEYQSPSYPVKSEADLPDVLYNDFHAFNSPTFFPCLSAKKPASALLVHALDANLSNYYILPFYKDNKVCALVIIQVKNGNGNEAGISGVFGETYPQVSAIEAKTLVEEKTGLKTIDEPVLAFQMIYEDPSPFSPFWKVQTADGQFYYVIFLVSVSEGGKIQKKVTVINARDVTVFK